MSKCFTHITQVTHITHVTVMSNDILLERAVSAHLRGCAQINVLPQRERSDADLSVLILDSMSDGWMDILRCDAARADVAPVPILLAAHRITESQLALAARYGVISFYYRDGLNLDQLLDAIIEAPARRKAESDDVLRDLLARLRDRRRQSPHGNDESKKQAELLPLHVHVLSMLAHGMETPEIAQKLNYSERMIKGLLHEASKKLQVANRVQAVAHAVRGGII